MHGLIQISVSLENLLHSVRPKTKRCKKSNKMWIEAKRQWRIWKKKKTIHCLQPTTFNNELSQRVKKNEISSAFLQYSMKMLWLDARPNFFVNNRPKEKKSPRNYHLLLFLIKSISGIPGSINEYVLWCSVSSTAKMLVQMVFFFLFFSSVMKNNEWNGLE